MSGIGTTSLGSMFGREVWGEAEEHRRQRVAESRRRWPELRREQLEPRGRYLVDRASGELYERVRGSAWHGVAGLPDAADRATCFYIGEDGAPILLVKPAVRPFTLQQLDAAEQARERADLDRVERHRAFVAAQPRRALTLADLDPRQTLSLRAAHDLIVELGGTVDPTPHGFRIAIPERFAEDAGADEAARQRVRQAASVLDLARELVRARLEAGRPLPDASPAIGGGA